jgi:hypothetical protein
MAVAHPSTTARGANEAANGCVAAWISAILASMPTPLPDRLRLPMSFDPALLVHDLQGLAAVEWTDHFVKQNYQGDWAVIPLRGPAGATHPVMMIYADPTVTQYADTPMLRACPYFRAVLDAFACPLQAVRLMRLTSGSRINEHRDHELSVEEGTVRIHIPVATNDGVVFMLNGTRVTMAAWYLRLSDPQSVTYAGPSDRVHMVIDAVANDWIRRMLEIAAAAAAAASQSAG